MFLWLCVTMYLLCGPRQLFFFQCGPETPKGWTPLVTRWYCAKWYKSDRERQTPQFHLYAKSKEQNKTEINPCHHNQYLTKEVKTYNGLITVYSINVGKISRYMQNNETRPPDHKKSKWIKDLNQGCPTFWCLWATLEEEELSWATC